MPRFTPPREPGAPLDHPKPAVAVIGWLFRSQWRMLTMSTLVSFAFLGCQQFVPYVVGRAVDDGLVAGDRAALYWWSAALAVCIGIATLTGVASFVYMMYTAMDSDFRVQRRLVDTVVAVGSRLKSRADAGELVSISAADSHALSSLSMMFGRLASSVLAFVLALAILASMSWWFALAAGVGVPAMFACLRPLFLRLESRGGELRQRIGVQTGIGTDAVAGLRVLRGIGGDLLFAERYRERSAALQRTGYRVANSSSWIHALRSSMPIVFVAAITWTGALLAADGAITIGGLASAFSFATIFIAVSGNFIGTANFLVAAWVAAGRIARFLAVATDVEDAGTVRGAGGELRDPDSGLVVPVGGLTVVVTAETAPALAACERLARYRDSEAVWGAKPLEEYALAEVRRRIMLLTDEDYLFAETLGATLRVEPAAALAAIETACAADVYTALGGSFDARLAEGGQNLSGGQRQRLRLARALAAAPETLLAVEPTSAVDSHTESLIAARVAAVRALTSTLIVTTSPLWLARADRVVWMVQGKVHATGSHAELLDDPAYRVLTAHGDAE